MKPSDILEGLDPQQKAAGQLGPTEKVQNNNIGKLVGANENFINTDAQAVVSEEDLTEHNHLIGVYRKGESQFQLWNEGQYQYKLTSMVGGVPKQYKQWNDFDLEEVKASLIQSGFQSMRTFTDESTKMDKNNLPKQYWNRDTQSIGPTPDAGLRYADPDEDGVHYPDYGNTKFGNTKFKGWRPSVKPQPQPTSVCKRKTDQQYANQLSNHYAQVYDKIRITFNRRKDIFTITGYNGAETDHIKYTIDPTTCKLRMMSRISVENESINQGVAEGMFTKDPAIDPTIGKQINDIINRLHNHAKRTKDEYLRAAVRGAVQELFDILRNTGGTYSPPGSPGVRDVAEGFYDSNPATYDLPRRILNVPELIRRGAIFVTYPHGDQGWETDPQEDWEFSLISLMNVEQIPWCKEAPKYRKPASYKNAEHSINSSAPNLGSNKLVYDGKYNQILWSIEKLGIPDNVAFLDKDKKGVAEGEGNREMWDRIRSKGIVPGIDREKYKERPGLEGPFHTKTGKVVYYDKQEGKYYDPDTDFYISHDDYQAMNEQGVAEGLPGEFIGGTAGGVGGAVVGAAVGGPMGALVGGAAGGTAGQIAGRELTDEQQLNEIAPLLALGARLFMAAAPKIAQVFGKVGQAGARGVGQAAKAGAGIAAKNAGQIGIGVGAYEIGSSVADIVKDITAKVGAAVDEKTIFDLATLAFKYAIPAGIVLAILYGGKKAIDSLFADPKTQQGVAEGECPMCVESGTTCKECSMQMESLSQILRNAGIKKV